MNEIRKLLSILPKRKLLQLLFLQIFIVFVSLFEMVGFSSVAPLIAVISDSSIIESNRYIKIIYEYFSFRSHPDFILFWGIAVVSFIILSNGLILLRIYLSVRFYFSLQRLFLISIRNYYVSKEYLYHVKTNSSGLINKIIIESKTVVVKILKPFLEANARFFTIIFYISGILILSPGIGISIILGTSIVYLLTYYLFRRNLHKNSRILTLSNKEKFRILQESLGNIKEIKLLGNDRFYSKSFRKVVDISISKSIANMLITESPRYVIEGLFFSGVIASILIYFKSSGEEFSTVIMVLSFLAIAGYKIMPAINVVFRSFATIKGASGSLEAIYDDLVHARKIGLPDANPETDAKSEKGNISFANKIELDNITFAYSKGSNVLNGLTIPIPYNSTIGIVGPSGAGKSTVVDTLLGLLTPDSGAILIDGVTVTESNIRQWQNIVGYVPQSIFLGDSSIKENIAFGVDPTQIDNDRIEKVSRMACLHGFVTTLDKNYDTTIGERGVQLSGGQRQRIAIARALYRDVDVLIFDEATSALDGITEREIMDSIQNLSHQKTLIIVAHRLTTLKDADLIYFLEKGKVVDSGSYSELLEKNKRFRLMSGPD